MPTLACSVQAGVPGQITIATNMAGRGTDIILGGNPKGLAQMALEFVVHRVLLSGACHKALFRSGFAP